MCFGALREGMRSEVRRVLSGLLWRLEGFAGGQGQGEARQLATRARLGTLCNLNFNFLTIVEIFGSDPKPPRCNLFNGA